MGSLAADKLRYAAEATKIAAQTTPSMEDLMQSFGSRNEQPPTKTIEKKTTPTKTTENIDDGGTVAGFKAGDSVEAIFSEDGQTHRASVLRDNRDGTYQVRWRDAGLGLPEESPVSAKDMKYPPISLDMLEVGQKYTGVVRSIVQFGAFVDIGAESNGLLHKSVISLKRVEDVHDFLKEGQQVEVWISRVQGGKIGLTMIEGRGGGSARSGKPDLTPFEWVSPQEWFEGTVHNLAPFGAFVTITLPTGEQGNGLIHKSQITNKFVKEVAEEIEIGQKVYVRIVSVEPKKNKMFLSMLMGDELPANRSPVDLAAFERIPSGKWLTGKVADIKDFGAFITVSTPNGKVTSDGLVHISRIKETKVNSVHEEFKLGQEVQVRVHSIRQGKLDLTMLLHNE